MKLYVYGVLKPNCELSYIPQMNAVLVREEPVILEGFQLGTSSNLMYPYVRPVEGAKGVTCYVWDFGEDYEKGLAVVSMGLCATKGLFDLVMLSEDECLFVAGPALLERLNSMSSDYYKWWEVDRVWDWSGSPIPSEVEVEDA